MLWPLTDSDHSREATAAALEIAAMLRRTAPVTLDDDVLHAIAARIDEAIREARSGPPGKLRPMPPRRGESST